MTRLAIFLLTILLLTSCKVPYHIHAGFIENEEGKIVYEQYILYRPLFPEQEPPPHEDELESLEQGAEILFNPDEAEDATRN